MESQGARFQGKIVVGVLAAVTDPAGRLLFVAQQKGPFGGHWLLPGGGVEPGESAEDAVRREILEETGMTMTGLQFTGVYEMRGSWTGGDYHLMMMGFRGAATGEIPTGFEGDGVGEVRWAHVNELPLHSTDLRILTDAGLAAFADAEIEAALKADGITMKVYR
ncbi:MAG TPA: NUDIX hydrolase [Symbiobacteriaceae bacterium]|nr:NUDIX hydrolase [Symbiobacteriaceae bacterium]